MHCPYCCTENRDDATKCRACASWMVDKPPRREWTRAREGRRVAGVCRGLADRFGIPVAAVRLMFLGSVFFGGWGILAYVALWIAMPLEPVPATQTAAFGREAEAAPAPVESIIPMVPSQGEPVPGAGFPSP
ncbi:MAG: PspC domain-containing protein [Deltaproteobacteria bacterium]|nr:PspC domain-containing protein [Deltaproteobacteria bacterium]